MATEVKRRRGTTIEHSTFTGAVAELTVDLTKDTVVVHDGATQGGFPLLREDFSNVPTTAPFTNISLDTAIFDTTYTETGSETQGTLYWNSDEETLSLVTNGESIELGQKVEIHVKNQTGAQINKGEVVYASGTVGASGRILVTKMIADGTVAAKRVLGVAAENIANGADGKVIKFGKLRQINTSTFSNGDILWVSTTTAGGFQNTEPVQANGEISLPIAYVVYSSASVGEIFVRVTPIDENEYQDYDAGLQDISGLTPSDSAIIVGDGTNWVAESGDTARASLGLTIGTHVQAWDAQLDTLSGLSADQATAIVAVTASEYQQLQNIDTVTISNTQWGYLGELDQPLKQADSPTFNRVVLTSQADDGTKAVRADRNISAGDGVTGGGDLTADRTITLGTPSTTTVGGSNAVTTNSHTHALDLSGRSITLSNDSDSVITFDTNTQNLGADRTYTPTIADHASGQRGVLSIGAQDIYGSKTVINDFKVTTKIESASGFTSGILGAGTIYNMNDGNGSFFEVDNMRIRNELRAHIFKKDIVKASNAYLFITDSAEIAEFSDIIDTTNTFKVLDETNNTNATFEHGDLLWAKNVEDDGSLQVAGVKIQVSAQPKYVWDNSTQVWNADPSIAFSGYTDEFASGTVSGGIYDGKPYKEYNIYEVTAAGKLNAGDTIVRVSDGSILNDASSQYSPFIDIYDGVQTWAQFQDVSKTKVRLGNLAGVSNASGYGLYTQNAFLTGALVVGDLTKVGQYMEFDGSTLTVKGDIDITGTTIFKSAKDGSSTPTILGNATYIDGGTIVTNSITATEIASNTITANEIDANTITANEIAAGTITANEIDVDNLFAQEIEVTGKLLATDGTYETTVGKLTGVDVKIGASTSNGDFYGLYRDLHNYFGIHDGDVFAEYAFRVGDANNYLEFDGTTIDIDVDTFDLTAGSMTIDSTNGITIGANDFFKQDKTFSFGGGILSGTSSTVSISGAGATIDVSTFELTTSNIRIDSSFDRANSNITSSVTYSDTLQFSGIFLDSDNYLGHITDVDTSANSGYLFRVGGTTSNFLEVNESGGIAKIVFDTFDLDATTLIIDSGTNSGKIALGATPPTAYNSGTGIYFDGTGKALIGNASGNKIQFNGTNLDLQTDTFDLESGNLHIDSQGTTFPSASSSPPATTGNQTGFDGSSWNATPLFINDKTTVKFYFDYDITTSGELEILLDVSTDNGSTYTNYTDSSTTAVINMSPEYCNGDADSGNGFEINVLSSFNNRIDQIEFVNPSGGRGSTGGRIAIYVYIAEIGDADAIRFQVAETGGSALPLCNATGIITQEFQSVTEINPSGVFVRLADAVVLANGDKYLDPELIT